MDIDPMFMRILKRQQEMGINLTLEDLYAVPLKTNRRLSVIFLTALSISIFCGLIGNILVIGAVTISSKLRTVGNMFIVNLAIADTLIVTIVEPLNIVGVVMGAKFFKEYSWICHATSVVCMVACVSSCMNMAGIAINRFIVITKFETYARIFTPVKTALYCMLIWILAFLVELPNLVGWGGHTFDLKTSNCVFDRLADMSYVAFMAITSVQIPLIIIIVCYTKLYLYVRKKRKLLMKYHNKPAGEKKKKDHTIALARTCFIVFITFFVCLTPYNLSLFFDRSDTWPNWLYTFFMQIFHFNSSLNFIIYGLTNKQFRDGYKLFLCRIFCIHPKGVQEKHSKIEISTSSLN